MNEHEMQRNPPLKTKQPTKTKTQATGVGGGSKTEHIKQNRPTQPAGGTRSIKTKQKRTAQNIAGGEEKHYQGKDEDRETRTE